MRGKNILHLGVKELWSLARDPIMLVLIVYAFTVVDLFDRDRVAGHAPQGADRHRGRGPVATVAADRQRLPAAAVRAAEAGVAGGDGRPDGRRAGHLRPQHSPQVPGGRAGRALARDPAQHRRDPRRPGVQRQRLRADDRARARCRRGCSATGATSGRR